MEIYARDLIILYWCSDDIYTIYIHFFTPHYELFGYLTI